MEERIVNDPDANPAWVLETKLRMPRHADEEDPEYFIASNFKPWQRWLAAEQDMMRDRDVGNYMNMADAFEKIRGDLGLARVAWQPQKWTTMVLGRPVQAQYNISVPICPQAEPDAREANSKPCFLFSV
jgi:hypothetical protein